MPSTQRTVTADDGVRLHVETWPAARPDAALVLGLHGLSANRLGFLPLVEQLAGEVEFVAYDARGRGRSDKPADVARYGHRRHAEDAAAVLRAIGRRADVVVGQSMGAWDGLLLAAYHPGDVGAIVLADGGWFADLPADVEPAEFVDVTMGRGWYDRMTAVLPSRDVLLAVMPTAPPFKDIWGPAAEAMLLEGLEELPDGTVRNACFAPGVKFDTEDYFSPRLAPYVKSDITSVSCPVHLVRATRGFDVSPETQPPLMPERAVEELRGVLPQLVVETVPDSNHFTVNFGQAGVTVLAEAVRKAIR
ncbi:MAG TPA: alpha/beta hydrolase [Mycobacteriales bacterium]|nr:alpha/beta hydrolase [Mycobacteriales bacterium]